MIWLVFAHFIGDWGLQTTFVAAYKLERWMIMLVHCMIWTACVCVAMEYSGVELCYWKIIYLFLGHAIIDYVKGNNWNLIYMDQFLHICQLFAVFYL